MLQSHAQYLLVPQYHCEIREPTILAWISAQRERKILSSQAMSRDLDTICFLHKVIEWYALSASRGRYSWS
jgi:hypothetical protein